MEPLSHVRERAPHLPILLASTNPAVRADSMEAGANRCLPRAEIAEKMPVLFLWDGTLDFLVPSHVEAVRPKGTSVCGQPAPPGTTPEFS